MTKKTIMDKVIETKKEEEKTSLIQKELKDFSNSLNQSQKKLVKDQNELIVQTSNNEIKNQSTNLEIAYNFSNKMRDFLPLNKMTTDDVRNFKDIEFIQTKTIPYASTSPPLCVHTYTVTRKSPKFLLTNSGLYFWAKYSDNIPRNTLGGTSKNRSRIGVKAPLGFL